MQKAFLAILLSITCLAWSADKDTAASNYISVLQRLQRLARDNRDDDPQPKLRSAIDALLPTTLSSEQLYRLGISAYLVAYPQEAGPDIPFDGVFDYASGRCAVLLAARVDSTSVSCLLSMKHICGFDGGGSLLYNELIARQEKLQKNAKTK